MPSRTPHSLDLHMRLGVDSAPPIGPGKIALLEAIAARGSISAAAREHGMSYSRAWKLVMEINQAFGEPVVVTAAGGTSGGGAALTPVAEDLVASYREAEDAGRRAAEARLKRLLRRLAAKT